MDSMTWFGPWWSHLMHGIWGRFCHITPLHAPSISTHAKLSPQLICTSIPNGLLFAFYFYDIHTKMIAWFRWIPWHDLVHGEAVCCMKLLGQILPNNSITCSYHHPCQASSHQWYASIPNGLLFDFYDIHTKMIAWFRWIQWHDLVHGEAVCCMMRQILPNAITISTHAMLPIIHDTDTHPSPMDYCLPFVTSIQRWLNDSDGFNGMIWSMVKLLALANIIILLCYQTESQVTILQTHRKKPS